MKTMKIPLSGAIEKSRREKPAVALVANFDDDFDMGVLGADTGDMFTTSGAMSWDYDGDVYKIDIIGQNSADNHLTLDLSSGNDMGIARSALTCFVKGTMIATETGDVAVENLRPGDMVLCGDGAFHPIRWTAERHVDGFELMAHPQFQPIRIRKGALGENSPSADLLVSPQHRVLVTDWRAELLFGEQEVLISAIHLVDDAGIARDHHAREVTYCQIMFDDHQTVWSNGLETESFYPGDQELEGVDESSKAELFRVFPELKEDPSTYGGACHPTLKAHEVMSMVGA